ncbi:AbrB/MazE/SpoVT family DNA-binding domain-containing protein [Methylocystis sp. SC2]|uniref:AbrB/MazE/SpoVT family DNA-binding domain-containing protein n=1 Tax=Methylocystis sp. (strain SC2) TaxID=187303 RepID=UPI000688B24C|nr:AbrB/MazE/SpoVT family DNA-binding domain-containing protein [Methylocystis sp. SC2]
MGNSTGLIIPKPFLAEIGADVDDDVELTVEKGRLVVTPLKKRVREGWGDDARRIAEHGDDALLWPEFGNEGDEKLTW